MKMLTRNSLIKTKNHETKHAVAVFLFLTLNKYFPTEFNIAPATN